MVKWQLFQNSKRLLAELDKNEIEQRGGQNVNETSEQGKCSIKVYYKGQTMGMKD